ncbi:MAG: hypothetical protein WHF31_06055 [Candidatus Dehalobacter alkaniphilus]
MIIEYCPKCRKVQNMLTTIEDTTVSYQCSVCNLFVRSEDSSQKVNQSCDKKDNTVINFSGSWVLNLEKSKLQSPPPESSIFHISHSEQAFSLERTHIINGVPDDFTIDLTTDGVTTRKNIRGIEITARMYWDGESLVSDMIFQQGKEEAVNIVKYSITDKGQTLVVEEDFTSSEHKHHNRWIFNKNEAGKPV